MSDATAHLDAAKPPRDGEALDEEKLIAWLRGLDGDVASFDALSVKQYPSGHSNLTYELTLTAGDTTRALVLRRPPFGNKVKSAHDMGREFRILAAIHGALPKAPKPVAHCDDESVLGAPFYVMEKLTGVILRRKLPAGLTLGAAELGALGHAFVDTLAEIHEVDYTAVGLDTLGKPEGYVERQVSGWSKRYEDAKTDDIPAMIELATWLRASMPKESGAGLIHNDFKYDNLVLAPEGLGQGGSARVIGVLDWEMSTIGDPLMDLGTALAYWVEAGDPAPFQTYTFGPTNLPGGPTRRDVLALYDARRPGVVPDDMRFYYAFAIFKNAVVAQQIYRRFKLGLTSDERFGAMIFAVQMLASMGLETTLGRGLE